MASKGFVSVLGISGMPELDEQFVRLFAEIKMAEREGLKLGGEIMAHKWKENIVSEGWQSPRDWRPLDVRNVPAHRYFDSIKVGDAKVISKTGLVTIDVYSDIEPRGDQTFSYPELQEYGWRGGEARPTMTPAFDDTRDEVIAVFAATVRTVVDTTFPARWKKIRSTFMSLTNLKSHLRL